MKTKTRLSDHYHFTTESLNDPRIASLKATVHQYNRSLVTGPFAATATGHHLLLRMVVRGRLGKTASEDVRKLYRRGGKHHRNMQQGSILLKHAGKFDVYVYYRSSRNYYLIANGVSVLMPPLYTIKALNSKRS
jgi:hypothetical protein